MPPISTESVRARLLRTPGHMNDRPSGSAGGTGKRSRRELLATVGGTVSLGLAGCEQVDPRPAETPTAAAGTPTEPPEMATETATGDPCRAGTTVELGTDRRFGCFDYGWTDPSETVQDEQDRARNLVSATLTPYVSPHSGRRYHLFMALINAGFSTQGYPSNSLAARSRWGQAFPVGGSGSREATVTVETTTEPTIVFDEREYALLLNVHPDLEGAIAQAELRVVLEDLTAGDAIHDEVVYRERVDGDSEQQWTYGERDTFETAIPATLTAGNTYRAYSEVGVHVSRGEAGYTGYPPSVVASFEATLTEIAVAF